jgi:hypothetical protein
MGKSGGGGRLQRKVKNGYVKHGLSQYFSARFLQLIRFSLFGFILAELLVVITIIGVLITLLLPTTVCETARRIEDTNILKLPGIALHHHHETYRSSTHRNIKYRSISKFSLKVSKQTQGQGE